MQLLHKLSRFWKKSPREKWTSARATVAYNLVHPLRVKANIFLLNRGWRVPRAGNDRTTYVIGLFAPDAGMSIGYYFIILAKEQITLGIQSASTRAQPR